MVAALIDIDDVVTVSHGLSLQILLAVVWVEFAYATQLGDWSVERYGPAAREFWGMAKHVADLPLKLALPLGLWAFFYLRILLPKRAAGAKRE